MLRHLFCRLCSPTELTDHYFCNRLHWMLVQLRIYLPSSTHVTREIPLEIELYSEILDKRRRKNSSSRNKTFPNPRSQLLDHEQEEDGRKDYEKKRKKK